MGDSKTPVQPKGSATILSEEMWEKILMRLTDPSDVLNVGKTCVQFQRILRFKMLEANLAKTLPFLMDYLDAKSVLNCRSVSQGWRDVVDKFFEDYFLGRSELEPAKKLGPFPVTANHCALYPFGMRNGVHERFIEEMKDHPRNPFIGRAVSFQLEGAGPQDRQNFRSVYNFFEIFGKHIWTFQLEFFSPGVEFLIEDEREVYFPFIIRDVFELAPNLKKIYINGVPLNVSMSYNEIRALPPLPSALENLQISTLPQINHPHRVPQDYGNAVIRAILIRYSNSQLRVLNIETLDPLRNLTWPNLKELHFTKIDRIDQLDVLFRHLRLPRLELLSISLGLKINCETKEGHKQWAERGENETFTKLFLALHHLTTWPPNLKILRFGTTWLWDKVWGQPLGLSKELPCPANIKTLEIPEETIYKARYSFNGTSDYSFLLRFPHVENIHVRKDNPGAHDRGEYRFGPAIDNEIVQVHKFMYDGRMYESNIWKALPKLNVFSYGERVYTRSSYEQRALAKLQRKVKERALLNTAK